MVIFKESGLLRLLVALTFIVGVVCIAQADRLAENIKSEYYRQSFENDKLPVDKRILYADSLMAVAGGNVPLSVYNIKSKMLSDQGRYEESLNVLEEMYKRIPSDSVRLKYDAMVKIGIVEFNRSNFCGAVDMAYRLLHEPKPGNLQYFDIYAYWIIIDFYVTAEQWDSAWKYQRAGLEALETVAESSLFPAEEHDYVESVFHRTAADLYLKTNQPDKAYEEIQKSVSLIKDDNLDWHTYITFAEIANKKGETALAEHYYREGLKAPYTYNYPVVGWVKMLLENKDARRADSLMRVYKDDLQKIKGNPLEREHLENMARYYNLIGDYQREAKTLSRIIAFSDSLYKASLLIGSSGAVSNKYEYEEVAETISGLRSSKYNAIVFVVVLAVLLLGMIVLSCSLLTFLRRRRRQMNSLYAELQHMEGHQKEATLEAEESIEAQNRELSTMAMYLARLNDAMEAIRNNVSMSDSQNAEKRIKEIGKIVTELEIQNNAWEMFCTYFNRVHQSFFKKLHHKHPTLTNAESRMCAFILMGLTTKEIAAFTNRSPRTVEAIKYNIRKKLNIEDSTENYLRKLSTSQI